MYAIESLPGLGGGLGGAFDNDLDGDMGMIRSAGPECLRRIGI